jgi:hypothetical protein
MVREFSAGVDAVADSAFAVVLSQEAEGSALVSTALPLSISP